MLWHFIKWIKEFLPSPGRFSAVSWVSIASASSFVWADAQTSPSNHFLPNLTLTVAWESNLKLFFDVSLFTIEKVLSLLKKTTFQILFDAAIFEILARQSKVNIMNCYFCQKLIVTTWMQKRHTSHTTNIFNHTCHNILVGRNSHNQKGPKHTCHNISKAQKNTSHNISTDTK